MKLLQEPFNLEEYGSQAVPKRATGRGQAVMVKWSMDSQKADSPTSNSSLWRRVKQICKCESREIGQIHRIEQAGDCLLSQIHLTSQMIAKPLCKT